MTDLILVVAGGAVGVILFAFVYIGTSGGTKPFSWRGKI